MKMRFQFVHFVQVLLGLALPFAAHATVGIRLTTSDIVPAPFPILVDRTEKFESDHTFVQLFNPKYNTAFIKVVNRNVAVILPARLNSDTLMEALIKIRAARTFGALDVTVVTPKTLRETVMEGKGLSELNLEGLMAVAGADHVNEKGHLRKISEAKPVKNLVTQAEYWVGGTNHPQLLSEVAFSLGKEVFSLAQLQAIPGQLKGRSLYWITANTPPINENFCRTLGEIQWLEKQGAVVHLISPYLPYARSDKPEFDVGVTTQGRLVADLIESVGTQGITVVRAHAPQSLGFFKIHAEEISGRVTLVKTLKDLDVDSVVSPDAGFQKDATKVQQDLSAASGGKPVGLVVMNKQRNSEGKETLQGGTGLENIQDKTVVIIDDETSSGGTLNQVAQAIQAYKPKSIFAVVTHLAGTGQKGLDSPFIEKLIVTDTVPVKVENAKLKVLSIAPELVEKIKEYESNRELH